MISIDDIIRKITSAYYETNKDNYNLEELLVVAGLDNNEIEVVKEILRSEVHSAN